MIIGYGSITITSLVDIESSTWYYTLSSSTPAKPTQNADPPSGWNKTEPSYTEGSALNLYIVNKIVYGDGTFEYSDVSLSSSYEAAKQANSKIDNLEIGGRNLLAYINSYEFPITGCGLTITREENGWLRVTGTVTNSSASVIRIWGQKNSSDERMFQDIGNCTFSVEDDGVLVTDKIKAQLVYYRTSTSSSATIEYATGSESVTVNAYNISRVAILSTNTAKDTVINGRIRFKLEKGNKATDWTPAPEDVRKYTDDLVDAIEIGGRNLLLNSDGQANKSVTVYTIGRFNFSEALIEGEEYTVRAYITTIDRTGIAFYHSGGTIQMGDGWIPINESNLYSTTFTATANMASQTSGVGYGYCNVYAAPNSGGGSCTIKWIKVEKGNKATDWTPAPEDIDARITGLNLSPFFSYTPFAVGDYWRFISESSIFTFTPQGDGWMRVQADNSAGSSYAQSNVMPYNNTAIKPGTDYTFLFEFRNNASTGSSTNSDVYIVQSNNYQFWGGDIKTLLSGVGANTTTNVITGFVPGTAGIYEKRFVKTSEPTDSEHWTGTVNSLVYLRFRCAAGGTQDYEVRVSLYDGEYTGPYKPYNINVSEYTNVKDKVSNFISNTYANDKANIQSQIDGKAETWYQSSDPSTAWTTAELRAEHTGDIWYKTTDNTTWYYDGTQWAQQSIPNEVFNTINGKAQIFMSQPNPPYSRGDLWFNGVTADILTCVEPRAIGESYAPSDWEKRNKYTDDTAVNNLEIGGRNLLAIKDSTLPYTSNGLTGTYESDGWIRITGTATNTSNVIGVRIWGQQYTGQQLFHNIGNVTLSVEDDGVLLENKIVVQCYYYSSSGTGTGLYIRSSGNESFYVDGYIQRITVFLYAAANGTVVNGRIRFKLEKGNKATDWSPAPEDIVAESVESIQVGGRNLYAVCNEIEGYIYSDGTISTPTSKNERTSDYIPVSVGDRYVLQSWVPSIPSDKQSWIGYHFYSDTSGTKVGSRISKYSENGGTYLCYDDITVPEGAAYIRVSYRRFEDGCCKLEIGNKPTDWTPAPEDVTNYTDETVDASQVMMAKKNLSPFFSYTLYANGNYYYANDNYYWRSVSKTATSGYTITSMGDGWIRVQKDNTSGNSNSYHGFIPFNNDLIKPGAEYTFLFEFRNNNSTGTGFANNFYIVQLDNTQFWGAEIRKNLSGARTTANVNLIADFPPGTSGVYEKRFVKASEPTGSSHWTGTLNSLVYVRAGCAVGDTLDCEVRVSLYEGEYTGPYKPYGVDVGDFAGVKTTANTALTTANGKNKVVYSTTQPSGVFVAGDTWFNTSTSGADAGKISKWNGSDWVAQEIGSASILANEALMNKLFAYDVTAANCITAPILISQNYNGTIDRTQTRPTYDNNNTAGSIFNLYEGKINIGGSLKYDSTNGLVLDGDLTATNGTITGATLVGEKIDISSETTYSLSISSIYVKNDFKLNTFHEGRISDNDPIYDGVEWSSKLSVYNKLNEQFMYDIGSGIKITNPGFLAHESALERDYSTLEIFNVGKNSEARLTLSNGSITVGCEKTNSITGIVEYMPFYVTCGLANNTSYNEFTGNIISNSTVVVVKKLGWCQVFGALKPTSSASDFVTILDSTKVPAPQHGVAIYEQSQYWDNGYTIPLRIRINASGGLDICKGYVGGSYGFSITYPIL